MGFLDNLFNMADKREKNNDGEVFTDKYAFAFKKGNTELEEKVNKVLQKLIDEGKVDEFTLKHTTGAGADADSKVE